jgi:hypothetical protein
VTDAPSPPTHALLTTAPLEEVLAHVGEQVPVGRLDGWTVVALPPFVDAFPTPAAERLSKRGERVLGILDNGFAGGVCVAVKGDATPMVWVPGWDAPSGRALDKFADGWRRRAHAVASLAGHPENGDALAQTLDAPGYPGHGVPVSTTVEHARVQLGIPAGVMGVSADGYEALADVAVAAPAKRRFFGRG